MAIVKCKVCGKEIDENILKCPGCDSLGPVRGRKIRRNMIIVCVLMMIAFGIGWYKKSQEVVKPIEQVQREATEDRLTQRGIAASLLLKTRLANPASMKITKALSNEDGSNLCFEYDEEGNFGVSYGKRIRLSFNILKENVYYLLESPLSTDQTCVEQEDSYLLTATVMDSVRLDRWLNGFGSAIWNVKKEEINEAN